MLLRHVERNVPQEIANDVHMLWVELGDGRRCDVAEGMRAQTDAQIPFGEWQNTSSFHHSDLLNLSKCAERAETWIGRQVNAS